MANNKREIEEKEEVERKYWPENPKICRSTTIESGIKCKKRYKFQMNLCISDGECEGGIKQTKRKK